MPTVIITDNSSGGNFAGVQDAQIRQLNPTTNYAAFTNMEATAFQVGDNTRSLIRFDGLSNVPAAATVSDVELILNLTARGGTARSIEFYRCLRNWIEGEVTFNAFASGNNWATAGGLGTGDCEASASLALTPSAGTGDKSFTGSGLTADVQAWVSGSVANNGWLMRHQDDPAASDLFRDYNFFTSEGTDGLRPRLVVTYTTGGAAAAAAQYYRRRRAA